jgi:hypothetical protein
LVSWKIADGTNQTTRRQTKVSGEQEEVVSSLEQGVLTDMACLVSSTIISVPHLNRKLAALDAERKELA